MLFEIVTDEVLKERFKVCKEELNEVKAVYLRLKPIRNEYYALWHEVKDLVLKREIHRELDAFSSIMYNVETRIRNLRHEIVEIKYRLNSRPSETMGYLYDDYHELDFDRIAIYGIGGCKL